MNLVAALAILIAPLSAGAAIFLWRLYREDRRTSGESSSLGLWMAVTGTLSAVAALWLACVAGLMLLERADLARQFGGVTVLALLGLDAIPLVNAIYLRSLRAKP